VEAAKDDGATAQLIVLLGGEAGLRCGEIMALEWAILISEIVNCRSHAPNGKVTSRHRRVAEFGTCP
jgi:hypothetical protein